MATDIKPLDLVVSLCAVTHTIRLCDNIWINSPRFRFFFETNESLILMSYLRCTTSVCNNLIAFSIF